MRKPKKRDCSDKGEQHVKERTTPDTNARHHDPDVEKPKVQGRMLIHPSQIRCDPAKAEPVFDLDQSFPIGSFDPSIARISLPGANLTQFPFMPCCGEIRDAFIREQPVLASCLYATVGRTADDGKTEDEDGQQIPSWLPSCVGYL